MPLFADSELDRTRSLVDAVMALPSERVADMLGIASYVLAIRGDETPRTVLEYAFERAVADDDWRRELRDVWQRLQANVDFDGAAGAGG